MKVERYYPQVGYQGQATKAIGPQQSGAAPIAAAIGQAAGVAGQFAQKYQEAQYLSDKTSATLEITKRVNAYYENRRTNPIIATEGQDIVALKEEDWQKFSQDLSENYINKLDNTRLREDMGNAWALTSEGYRNNVVESAQNLNIEYMANKAMDSIQTFTDFGSDIIEVKAGDNGETINVSGYDKAIDVIFESYGSGLMSIGQKDEAIEYVNKYKVLERANTKESVAEQKQEVDMSDLTLESKVELKKVIDSNEKERKLRYEEYKKEQSLIDMDDTLLRVSQGELFSITQYDAEVEAGNHPFLDGKEDQYVRERIKASIREREDRSSGKPVEPSDFAEGLMSRVFMDPTSTRTEALNMLYQVSELATIAQDQKWRKMIESNEYPRLNNQVSTYVKEQLKAFEKEGLFGKEPTEIANASGRVNKMIFDRLNDPSLTAQEIATETGFTMKDAEDFFYEERGIAMGYNLDNNRALREGRGNTIVDDAERLLQSLEAGQLAGRIDRDAIQNYIKDVTMSTTQLREELSRPYGKEYKELSKDEKAQVNLTTSTGKLYRLTKEQWLIDFKDLGVDGALAIDTDTGQPLVQSYYIDHSGEPRAKIYKMTYNEAGNEEEWLEWTEATGWKISPLTSIPNLEHKGLLGNAFKEIGTILEGPTIRERAEAEEAKLRQLDIEREETINPWKKIWGNIFGD